MRAVNLPLILIVMVNSFVGASVAFADDHQRRRGGELLAKSFRLPVALPAGVSHEGVFNGEVATKDTLDVITPFELPRQLAIMTRLEASTRDNIDTHMSLLAEIQPFLAAGYEPPKMGCYSRNALAGRMSEQQRAKFVWECGGTNASETAVGNALNWIASRQSADGSWSFNHNQNVAGGAPDCPNPGTLDARYGATGLALLPFLGAGQTHKEGSHKKPVYAALAYLIKNMRVADNAGSWEDNGRLLSHAWAALAMCEAYAMTHDKDLLAPAQLSLNYLVAQQDHETGGWASSDKGQDTVLAAWCLLALKSGHRAYLQVPKGTIIGAKKFLDARAVSDGAFYRRYDGGKPDKLATASGVLSQMYLGWKQDHPPLVRAVAAIGKAGPSAADARYNFLATNVMFQFSDERWKQWNTTMRDALVKSQAADGAAKGSWYFDGGEGAHAGGRLYHTALSAMTLEVYYRHLPIYRRASE